jgi:hypothetical protein
MKVFDKKYKNTLDKNMRLSEKNFIRITQS